MRGRVVQDVGEAIGKTAAVAETPKANGMAGVAKAAPKNMDRVEIPKLDIRTFQITLVGDSPLIVHRFSEKAKKQMLDKQMKVATAAKVAKDPFRDYAESMYWLSPIPAKITPEAIAEAKFGFPAIGFKAAAVDACSHVSDLTKVEARGAFHIPGEFVEIIGHPQMREDVVRIAMGTADLRYRGEFKDWKAQITVRHNARVLSAEQIINLFNTAGFAIGVGEWRPQKDGMNGMFHVVVED